MLGQRRFLGVAPHDGHELFSLTGTKSLSGRGEMEKGNMEVKRKRECAVVWKVLKIVS